MKKIWSLLHLKWLWAFLVDRRALAHVVFRCQHASGPTKDKLADLAFVFEGRLLKRPAKSVLRTTLTAG
ncbi:MAG: hypothetical protein ACLQO1_13370 [Steroidobacteraceae bacterium]